MLCRAVPLVMSSLKATTINNAVCQRGGEGRAEETFIVLSTEAVLVMSYYKILIF